MSLATNLLTVRALGQLFYVDLVSLFGFKAVRQLVSRNGAAHRSEPRIAPSSSSAQYPSTVTNDVADVERAVRAACMIYFKGTRCLQRAAVVTCMLRRRGIPAELVIGYQALPLRSHAWVEVDQQVVSDYMDGLNHFRVIDRW
jgi:Transglutaminase-like superfamily